MSGDYTSRNSHRSDQSQQLSGGQQQRKTYEFKIVLLGDRGVGKTCLVLRFIEGLYNSRQQSTIGAFFLTKKIVTGAGDSCKIQIWDTAGQERFRAMAPMYYRNAAAAIVCFDVTDESTFSTMMDWVEELKTNVVDKNLVIAIACNKADLDTRQVSRARAESFARSIDAIILDTSAKENFGVTELFTAVSEQVIQLRGDEVGASVSTNNRLLNSRGINLNHRPHPKPDDRSNCNNAC